MAKKKSPVSPTKIEAALGPKPKTETVRQRVIRTVLNYQRQFTRHEGPFDDYDYKPDQLPPCSMHVPAHLRQAFSVELMKIELDLQDYQPPLPAYNTLRTIYLQIDPDLAEIQRDYAALIAHSISCGHHGVDKPARASHLRLVYSAG